MRYFDNMRLQMPDRQWIGVCVRLCDAHIYTCSRSDLNQDSFVSLGTV